MPEQPHENFKPAQSLGFALGVTEYLFLAGLALLATGVSLVFSVGYALIVAGGVLVVTAWVSLHEDGR